MVLGGTFATFADEETETQNYRMIQPDHMAGGDGAWCSSECSVTVGLL